MSVKNTLIATKALIDTPEKWAKHYKHMQVDGVDRYCLTGALDAVAGLDSTKNFVGAYDAILAEVNRDSLWTRSIVSFNDSPCTSHDDVMKVLDKTIERAV